MNPKSPVKNHPSLKDSLVFSGKFKYPLKTFFPLTSISSFSIFTSTPFIGTPTEPSFIFSSGLNETIGDVSVSPYPSIILKPSAHKSLAISKSSFAPPLTKNFIFPPN